MHAHSVFLSLLDADADVFVSDRSTQAAIARFRARVIMSVTIKESTPFCCPMEFTNPRRTLMFGWSASVLCCGVGPMDVPSYQ